MKHLMNKVSLTVAVDGRAEGYALNQELGQWFLSDLLPELEALFEQLIPEDQLLHLDQLELELPPINMNNWQDKLRVAILEAMEVQLKALLAGRATNGKIIPSIQGHFEAWLYFLHWGKLPLYHAPASEQERLDAVLQEVASRRTALEQLLQTLRNNTPCIERLVKQHEQVFLIRLAGAICGRSLKPLFEAFQALGNYLLEPDFRALVREYTSGTKSKTARRLVDFKTQAFTTDPWPKEGGSVARALTQRLGTAFFRQVSETGGLIQEESLLKKALQDFFKEVYEVDFEFFIQKITTLKSTKHSAVLLSTRLADLQTSIQHLPSLTRRVMEAFLPMPSVVVPKEQSDYTPQKPVLSAEKLEGTDHQEAKAVKPEARPATLETKAPLPQDPQNTLPFADALHLEKPDEANVKQAEALHEASDKNTPTSLEDSLDETPQFLQNAGLVLLHPFLAHLFEHCAYTEGKDFKSEYTRTQAIQLLHYIATGVREAPEYELYFPKFLCAWEMTKPIEREFLPEPEHVQEAENMMQAAIQHWGALGKVSNDSLRQGFLQRPGKLSRREDHYLLQVEAQTLDILLQKLPWGMGIFKLPWMKNLLHVEWNS